MAVARARPTPVPAGTSARTIRGLAMAAAGVLIRIRATARAAMTETPQPAERPARTGPALARAVAVLCHGEERSMTAAVSRRMQVILRIVPAPDVSARPGPVLTARYPGLMGTHPVHKKRCAPLRRTVAI
jgi:hypothetical protein